MFQGRPPVCKTAPADLLRADYMARTGLGRRSMGATLDGKCAIMGHGRITIMLPQARGPLPRIRRFSEINRLFIDSQ